MTLPNFLVVGAMRSGTTTLARSLGAHPEVFVAPEKEIHFFDRHYREGLGWYERRFAGAQDARAVGEATQTYMYNTEALTRAARDLATPRLLAILRDPVARAYSHHRHSCARDKEWLGFLEAIEAEPERLAHRDWDVRARYGYVDRGRYGRQLEEATRLVGRDALEVVFLDDLVRDPGDTYDRVCRFLDVREGVRPAELTRRINAHVTFRSLRVRTFATQLPALPRRVVERLNTRAAEPTGDPPPDAVARIRSLLRDDRARLADLVGREPPWPA